MFAKYNLLPGSCHFMPFSVGEGKSLHYSYTATKMYCKSDIEIYDESFVYVEVRELDKKSHEQLNSMSADNYIGPMQLFANLHGNRDSQEKLDTLLYEYRILNHNRLELNTKREEIEPISEDHIHIEAQLEFLQNQEYELLISIQIITTAFDEESDYDWKTESINPS